MSVQVVRVVRAVEVIEPSRYSWNVTNSQKEPKNYINKTQVSIVVISYRNPLIFYSPLIVLHINHRAQLYTYYNKRAAIVASTPAKTPAAPKVVAAAPGKGVTDGALGDVGAVPLVPFVDEPETRAKLAQVRRVVLLLWMTMDLSPKKYGEPGVVDRYGSVYMTFQVWAVILPCLPARSPAWHVWGASVSQEWSSPRSVGSRWPMAAVQLPPAGIASWWMW